MKKKTPSKMVYVWGTRSFATSPQVVGEAVDRIAQKQGCCTPGSLVEEARDDKSVLHPLFTWDNDLASTRWRHHEARQVLGALSVTIQTDGVDHKTPAFVSVGHTLATQEFGEGYRSTSVVMADPVFAQEALAEALSRMNALRLRYAALEALAPVWQALDEIAAD